MSILLKFVTCLPLLVALFSASASDKKETFKIKDGQKIQTQYTYDNGALGGATYTDNKLGDTDAAAGTISIIVPGEFGPGNSLKSKAVKIVNADGSVQGFLYELGLSNLQGNFTPINLPVFEAPTFPLIETINFAFLTNAIQTPSVGMQFSIQGGFSSDFPGASIYILPSSQNDFIDESFFLTATTFTGTATVTSIFTTSPVPETTPRILFLIGLAGIGFVVRLSRNAPLKYNA